PAGLRSRQAFRGRTRPWRRRFYQSKRLADRCDSCLSRYPQGLEYRTCGKTLNNQRKEDETENQGENFALAGDRGRDAQCERERQCAPQPGPHQAKPPPPCPEVAPRERGHI